jgi:leukotriene-A4 hydrolase
MCRCQIPVIEDFGSSVILTSSQAVSTHLALDWIIDLKNSRIVGYVDIACRSQEAGTCNLTLDSRDLETLNIRVRDISRKKTGFQPVGYTITDSGFSVTLGSPVSVDLPEALSAGHEYIVRVSYSTTDRSSALQWLSSEQTNSKKYPFLFSQCQAIHARSMIPCQDLCQVKVTYSARVRCPSQLTVLMSARRQGDSIPCAAPEGIQYPSECDPSAGWSITQYDQPIPIPAYLIAIACGELDSRQIGPRTTVWADSDVVEKAAWEFADTEQMIVEAEKICGPYRFGVYDILVLNRGFPYGGMENVNLTFVTPTLLAGDRSQVAVIAHELAHSWSGNLVTNKTWTDFWINEGLTVFTETKIVQAIFGSEAGAIRLQEGWEHLEQYVKSVGEKHNFTRLCPSMNKGDDPDDSFSVVPYEKGASLFWFLQSLVGKDSFEKFIIEFFNEFACESISSQEFASYTVRMFPQLEGKVNWEILFSEPGMPDYRPPVDRTVIQEALTLADEWIRKGENGPTESPDVVNWPSGKKCIFINSLLGKPESLTGAKIKAIADQYQVLDTNCEVRCAFITLMLKVAPDMNDAKLHAVKLATEQGRMKFTRPMYRELFKVDRDLARETFLKHKKQYHPICEKMVTKDLEL